MIIDPHAHIAPASWIKEVRAGRFGPGIHIEPGEKWEKLVTKTTVLGKERVHHNPLPKETYDVALRLSHMEQMGVDKQILSVVPPMTFYSLDAELNKDLAASLNDSLSSLAHEFPDKFLCMATAPLQAPEAAAARLNLERMDIKR